MRFAHGETRWVILTERYAIKIARIRPFRTFSRVYQHLRGRKVNPTLLTYDRRMAKACIKHVIPGIAANRAEMRLYRRFGSQQLAPTLCTILWLVNIQMRGEPATRADAKRHPLWQALHKAPLFADTARPYQFCIIKGVVCLADYGRNDLESFLAR